MKTVRMLCLTAAMTPLLATAQSSPENAERRHSFAQAYGGIDWMQVGDRGGAVRATVGGLHFWGHADLFVRFAFQNSKRTLGGGFQSQYFPGIETGGNVYPWALTKNTIRPFVGISWTSSDFSLRSDVLGEGPKVQIHSFPVRAGVGVLRGPIMLELMAQYLPRATTEYPVAGAGGKAAVRRFGIPRWQTGLSLRFLRDATRRAVRGATSYETPSESRACANAAPGTLSTAA